jgi:EAL domain-containing protein (putative c-di-GMP-specific phosphodiesterase class I)
VKCVAEGVEEPEQRVCLSELGCVLGQGYHFARPMSAEALGDYLELAPTTAPTTAPASAPRAAPRAAA